MPDQVGKPVAFTCRTLPAVPIVSFDNVFTAEANKVSPAAYVFCAVPPEVAPRAETVKVKAPAETFIPVTPPMMLLFVDGSDAVAKKVNVLVEATRPRP